MDKRISKIIKVRRVLRKTSSLFTKSTSSPFQLQLERTKKSERAKAQVDDERLG